MIKQEHTMIDNLFLCVGAQKAGTTWLHHQLVDHPDVAFSDVKEVHYFNTIHNQSILLTSRKVEQLERLLKNNRGAIIKYFTKLSCGEPVDPGIKQLLSPVDDQWYINLFKNKKKKYSADFSPEYAALPVEGFEHIKRVSQNQKILFIMRDPIARAKSAIQYYFQMQNIKPEQIDENMIWDIAKKDFIVNLSSYEKTVENLILSFTSDQIKFLFFEDAMLDKQKTIDDICAFLDISTMPLKLEKSEERINSSEKIIFPDSIDDWLKERLSFTYSSLKEKFNLPKLWHSQ